MGTSSEARTSGGASNLRQRRKGQPKAADPAVRSSLRIQKRKKQEPASSVVVEAVDTKKARPVVPLPTNRSKISKGQSKVGKGAGVQAPPRICIDLAAHKEAMRVAAAERARAEVRTGNEVAGPRGVKRTRVTEL